MEDEEHLSVFVRIDGIVSGRDVAVADSRSRISRFAFEQEVANQFIADFGILRAGGIRISPVRVLYRECILLSKSQ
ncbi:hypothetical protein [Saccharibacillus qingshengii]|uniref:hypothetical protein n=1 Tax=Saccharibacillus qingshengii TaxID=1763540 RepID=UPI001FEB8CE7|nr:hypothetical protein [Saccharibacillus qingshengii]